MDEGSCILAGYYPSRSRLSTPRTHAIANSPVGMDRTALGRRVLALRTAKGLSLRALASAANVSHGYVHALEEARPNANITLERLEQIVTALGARVSLNIVEGEEGATSDPTLDELSAASTADRELLVRLLRLLNQAPTARERLEFEARMLEQEAAEDLKRTAVRAAVRRLAGAVEGGDAESLQLLSERVETPATPRRKKAKA